MRDYIIALAGAGILCAFSGILCPEKWLKYIRLFTGLIITVILIAPANKLLKTDIFTDFSYAAEDIDRYYMKKQIISEFTKNIQEDIKKRLLNEFGVSVTVQVNAAYNEEFDITGISEIIITGAEGGRGEIVARLVEIYGINKKQVKFREY